MGTGQYYYWDNSDRVLGSNLVIASAHQGEVEILLVAEDASWVFHCYACM